MTAKQQRPDWRREQLRLSGSTEDVSTISALLLQGNRNRWTAGFYDYISTSYHQPHPYGSLIWERYANRKRRFS